MTTAFAETGTITGLLGAAGRGEPGALDAVMPLVYGELRKIAAAYMRGQRPGHTLQTTALIHEAYLKIASLERLDFHDRVHFYGVAAAAMRHILLDHAKAAGRGKRGGGAQRISLDAMPRCPAAPGKAADVEALDDAMRALEKVDPRKARILELRYFGGLGGEEIAEVTGASTATVTRELRMGQSWLRRQLEWI